MAEESKSEEAVVTLDSSNFEETIAKSSFIAVQFYYPWCGHCYSHCKKLAPEWDKAAALLLKHDPPIILAKVDTNEEANKELISKYRVHGLPTIKIFRNEGKNIQDYKGTREADGVVDYLKKLSGPASFEIKSSEDAKNILTESKVTIVGVFPEFSGKEFENFKAVAEKLRSDYDFSHVKDAKLLPKGDVEVKGPLVRLLKPFDELFVDTQDFDIEALEKFVQVASAPLVTIYNYNEDPVNQPYVVKFAHNENTKATFLTNFALDNFETLKSKFYEVASSFKGKDVSFMIRDLNEEIQAPYIVIQENDGTKYLNENVEADQMASWFKEYTEGSLKPNRKSEPIPEVNNEPVKVVVADNINDVVKSGKNVLIVFYAPWCEWCKKLAPILDEVAVTFEKDPDVVIAKMDGTTNDIPSEYEVKGYPTLYFSSASGKVSQYEGDRTADAIISFINSNKESSGQSADQVQTESESTKDEL